MAKLQPPTINGKRYSFASIEIDIDGAILTGVTDVSYDHALTPGETRSNGSVYVTGRTLGEYAATGSFPMLEEDATKLRQTLGDGYMTRSFDVTVSFSEGDNNSVDRLLSCRITKEAKSYSASADALKIDFELSVHRVVLSGVDPIEE